MRAVLENKGGNFLKSHSGFLAVFMQIPVGARTSGFGPKGGILLCISIFRNSRIFPIFPARHMTFRSLFLFFPQPICFRISYLCILVPPGLCSAPHLIVSFGFVANNYLIVSFHSCG
jgi:hypothetical protein